MTPPPLTAQQAAEDEKGPDVSTSVDTAAPDVDTAAPDAGTTTPEAAATDEAAREDPGQPGS